MSETPLESERDDTIRDMLSLAFHGRTRWMGAICYLYILLFTAVAVVSAVLFFRADTTRDWILWAAVFLAALILVAVTKMWFWMLINRNSIKRDLRRLAERIDAGRAQ